MVGRIKTNYELLAMLPKARGDKSENKMDLGIMNTDTVKPTHAELLYAIRIVPGAPDAG